MNLNKPPKAALSTLVRRALMNRYDYKSVSFSRTGSITVTIDIGYGEMVMKDYGNLSSWSWKRTESMCVAVMNGETRIFTFAPDA